MGSVIRKVSKAVNQCNDLKKDLKNFENNIRTAKNALNEMMKGDGADAYWQGDNAADWYLSAMKALNHIMNNYGFSYDEFKEYATEIEIAQTKTKYKGGGAALKALCKTKNGSSFTKGTLKSFEAEKYKMVLPSTVNRDTANDDQTINSYKKFSALKNSLEELTRVCNIMKTDWDNIYANTKGDINKAAKTRSNKMTVRKREINSVIDSIETNYIGDILFSGRK